jgi:hypothetical protein
MPYTIKVSEEDIAEKKRYLNSKGNAECVEFVRQTTDAPGTPYWKPGKKVADASLGEVKRGTAIATFDRDGRYPTDVRGRHAAIYLSHNVSGIVVLDQWNAKGQVSRRTIRFNPKAAKRSDDAATYFVIE